MLSIVAPGQGSQRPGQLTPWLDLPGTAELVGRLGEAAGLDLLAAGTTWSAEQIVATEVAQPLTVATSLVAGRALLDAAAAPDVLAGHSVGEWTAAALAGVLTDEQAMALVGLRGREMGACCRGSATGMSAVLGGERDVVLERLTELGLEPANLNAPGQVVAGGPLDALAELTAAPPAGARVRALAVAGAFHTAAMAPAVAPLEQARRDVSGATPATILLSNADGAAVTEGDEVLDRLVRQVARPVRWDLCMATLAQLGTTALVELAPAGTLSALAKRGLPGIRIVALDGPDKLADARELLAPAAAR
jgi:[acyl-carrier-protein] S-malonyltransferase